MLSSLCFYYRTSCYILSSGGARTVALFIFNPEENKRDGNFKCKQKEESSPFSYLPFVAGLCNGNSCCMPILLSVFVTSNYWRVFRFEVLLGFPCVYLLYTSACSLPCQWRHECGSELGLLQNPHPFCFYTWSLKDVWRYLETWLILMYRESLVSKGYILHVLRRFVLKSMRRCGLSIPAY
jgi:hypothetical protein